MIVQYKTADRSEVLRGGAEILVCLGRGGGGLVDSCVT